MTAVPVTKIVGELVQMGLNIQEAELAEWAAKIITTEDIVEQGHKYGFLILIMGKEQYGQIIGNGKLWWETPEDMGEYNDSI